MWQFLPNFNTDNGEKGGYYPLSHMSVYGKIYQSEHAAWAAGGLYD